MQIELEGKFLDIDVDSIRHKLKERGAIRIHPEIMMKRRNFDYPDGRLDQIGGWIRVRDEGHQVTLSYKRLFDRTLEGTKEISVTVNDFEATCNFLLAIGLELKSYQETKRERWDLHGVEVTIDTWPWIPTFLEIEADTTDKLKSAAKQLELDWSTILHGSVETAYQRYFDITEAEIDECPQVTFVAVPDWLEIKRIPV